MKTVFDMHTHTISSGHAYSTIQENAAYASSIGLEILGMSDHAPNMPGAPLAYYFANQKIIPETIFGVRILKGAELNILDSEGNVDLYGEILDGLDFAIASLHPPCIPFGSVDENTEALVNAMKNPKINIIGHPGDPRYLFDIPTVVKAAIATNTLLEINNSSLNLGGIRAGGEFVILDIIKECKKRDYPIILGSDAHISFEIGGFDNIYKLLDKVNMPQDLILNTSSDKLWDFIGCKK